MLCKCHWIVLYIVHVTAFCLGGPFFSGHGVFAFCSIQHLYYIFFLYYSSRFLTNKVLSSLSDFT